MIKEWEKGKYLVSRRYKNLFAAALELDKQLLFGGRQDPAAALRRSDDGRIMPDGEDRLALAMARPIRLDVAALDALASILPSQRKLEELSARPRSSTPYWLRHGASSSCCAR